MLAIYNRRKSKIINNTQNFSPLSLFAQGEQGAWYDPSDISTMFQDSAGTTPVTEIAQPVGLILDKWLQAGYIAVSGLGWTRTAGDGVVTVNSEGTTVTVTGATTRTTVQRTSGSIPFIAGIAVLKIRADYSSATGVTVWLRGSPSSISSGVNVTGVESLNNSYLERLDVATGTVVFTINSFSYWAGNHASQATAVNRPVYQVDGNVKSYLAFNGTNSSLSTASINFNATGKISVFAGIRNLGTGSEHIILENDITNAQGTTFLTSRPSINRSFSTSIRSPEGSIYVEGFTTPITAVVTSQIDRTQNTVSAAIKIRVNGLLPPQLIDSTGIASGGFGTLPMFIGARGGTSRFFNGNIYSLIIRGAASSDSQISQTETYVNSKTGAY